MHTGMTKNSPPAPLPYQNKGNLIEGPVLGHLIRMTLPMIWGLFAVIAVQLADVYFISLMDNTHILAGISFTFPITMLISHLVFGINIALSSVVARLIGAKLLDDMHRVVLHGIMMAVTASSIIALLTFMMLKPLFYLLGADELTYPAIADYMPLWLLASALLAIPVNANSAMRAAGDTMTPALVMSTIALVNFILDPLLIFGYFGFPEMGVTGAALATLIAYCMGLVLASYMLAFRKKLIALDGLHLDKLGDSLRRLIVIAIPAGIANIIQPATNAVIVALLANHGSAAVAAFGVASRVEAFAFIFVISLALGMAPIIGQNWGAGNYKRVHQTIDLAIGFNLAWSIFVAVMLSIFAGSLAGIFSQDPEVIHYASLFFWIVPVSYGFGNLVFGWSSAFNAMGMPKRAFVMIAIKSLVLTLPAVYIGGKIYGVTGILVAVAATNILSGLFFDFISRRYCRHYEDTLQSDQSPA